MRLKFITVLFFLAAMATACGNTGTLPIQTQPMGASASASAAAWFPAAIPQPTSTPVVNQAYYTGPALAIPPVPTQVGPDEPFVMLPLHRFGSIGAHLRASVNPYDAYFVSVLGVTMIEGAGDGLVYNLATGQQYPVEIKPPSKYDKNAYWPFAVENGKSREMTDTEVYIPSGATMIAVETELYDAEKQPYWCNKGVNLSVKVGSLAWVRVRSYVPIKERPTQDCSSRSWSEVLYPFTGLDKTTLFVRTGSAVFLP